MRRDEQRLEQLAETHAARVLAYLVRRTNDPADAADVFQAVLVAAWRRLGEVPDDDQAALAWLIGTARRCLANDRRGHGRRLRATERLRTSVRLTSPEAAGPAPGVTEALMDLADTDREILALVYWEDLTLDQVAKVLDVTPVAARKRLERARSRLRSNLEASRAGASCEPA